jgi:signal transduction histidine kinase
MAWRRRHTRPSNTHSNGEQPGVSRALSPGPSREDDDLVELSVEVRAVLELAAADDVETGMARVVAILRRFSGARRIEWWTPDDEGEPRLIVADGEGLGRSNAFPVTPAGAIVVLGDCEDPRLASMIAALVPVLRRRCAEERLAQAAMQLARRNEALEDFAALVAHELKTPLQAALLTADASGFLNGTIDLVDSLLEAACESRQLESSSAATCLDEAVRDLGAVDIAVAAKLSAMLPIPATSLRVILRNLLRNAVAAGARHVHVTAVQSSHDWRLYVDDDGAGLADVRDYAAGNGLGLNLCRRIARRYGGTLELEPRPAGGARATLSLERAF